MNFKQKILAGLVLFISASILPVFIFAPKVQAATVNDESFTNPTYVITAFQNCNGTNKPKTIQVTIASQQFTFTDSNPCDSNMNLKTAGTQGFICAQTTPTTGINLQGSGNAYTGQITINYKDDTGEICSGNADEFLNKTTIKVSVNTNPSPSPSPGDVSGSTNPEATCESSSSTALEWIMCPLFNIASELANKLIDLFESQLCFRTEDSANPAIECSATDTSSIKPAWSAIKNIVSALLVIIMLIAIFAQAASIGPVDAYTLRKLLPRLVAAVILIQISFYLFSWVVNVVDDIGEGMMSLFETIFPADINNLNALLANAGVRTGTAAAVNWITIIGLVALGLAALPAVLLALFGAVIAVLIGLAVLIFRKVLIIAFLLIAPVALLFWVLPNTERYWKMWWDNFLKVLLMFPIIVLIIEAGRIFAYSAGSAFNGGFIALFVVLIGFFGPLLILPKTFRWGGGLMQLAGNSLSNASRPLSERSGSAFKAFGERKQGEWAKQYNPQGNKYGRALRRIQSGHFIPAVPGLKGAAERSRRLTIAAGDKWAAERNDEAQALVGRSYEKALAGGYDRLRTDENGNYLDTAGNKVDKAHAHVERLRGVEAGKQALVDMVGLEGSDANVRAAMAAHKMLLDTSSEIELQNARIQGGRHEGKRVSEVPSWETTLENSPQHYGTIARSRPDMAPDVKEGAEKEVSRKLKRQVSYETATADETRQLDIERLSTALQRMSPEGLAQAHYGFFQDITRVGDAGLSNQLAEVIDKFNTQAGQAGVNAVGALRGGKEKHVDAALALSSASLDQITRGVAAAAARGTAAGYQPQQPAGEVRIEHGPEISGPGTQFPGTQIYEPQERRTRPPEPPLPTPPTA